MNNDLMLELYKSLHSQTAARVCYTSTQRRETKLVLDLTRLNYKGKLKQLGLTVLETRTQ